VTVPVKRLVTSTIYSSYTVKKTATSTALVTVTTTQQVQQTAFSTIVKTVQVPQTTTRVVAAFSTSVSIATQTVAAFNTQTFTSTVFVTSTQVVPSTAVVQTTQTVAGLSVVTSITTKYVPTYVISTVHRTVTQVSPTTLTLTQKAYPGLTSTRLFQRRLTRTSPPFLSRSPHQSLRLTRPLRLRLVLEAMEATTQAGHYRDVNSVLNLLWIGRSMVETGTRPTLFHAPQV